VDHRGHPGQRVLRLLLLFFPSLTLGVVALFFR
jgi:hypothetical protein